LEAITQAKKKAAAAATADENVVEFKALPLKGEGWEGCRAPENGPHHRTPSP
jgi:hypothetical protein